MDKKSIIGAVIGMLVAFVVTQGLDIFKRGTQSMTQEQIEKVLDKKLKTTINGETKTYGEALSMIAQEQALMKQALETLAGD